MDSESLVFSHFPDLSEQQKARFKQLGKLYLDWNQKINVISRKDMDHFYERHVLHSLGIARVVRFKPGQQVLDIGTGGGFPGIPLAILFPETNFRLIDSIQKKIRVVNEVVQALGLTNVSAEAIRIEQDHGAYDYVVSRAVSRTSNLLNWTSGLTLQKNSDQKYNYLLLKGGDLEQELKETGHPYQVNALSEFFSQEFFETKSVVGLSVS